MARQFSACLYMREIDSASRGYFTEFGAIFDICCEPREKVTECGCALNEAIHVCVYMRRK